MTTRITHLQAEDLPLQLTLEVQKLLDGQLLVQLRAEKVGGQGRVDALRADT